MSEGLSAILTRYRRGLERLAQDAAGEATAEVIARTPVDTGRARASWKPSGNPRALHAGQTYTLTSSLSYIRPLEYGWSRQAPGGMVRVTVARWQAIVNEAARGF